jgi:hypothetical protein
MLDEAADRLAEFLVLPCEHARTLFTLWAGITHARIDGWPIWGMAPRLSVISDEPSSGKSLALQLVMALSYKGETVEDPSGPGLLQMIVEDQQSVGIDEFDILVEGSGGGKMTRSILNGGAYPWGKISRAGHKGVPTFAFVAYSGLAQTYRSHPKLEATRTRGVCVEMRQARPDESRGLVEFDYLCHRASLHMLRDALSEHIGAQARTLRGMERAALVPDGVISRDRQMWRPMLALAELAGGDWPERARAACRWFTTGDTDDQRPRLTPRQQLVSDLAEAMMGEPFVRTLVLLQRLTDMGHPFVTGDPATAVGAELNRRAAEELSRMLGGYVAPTKRRIDGRPVQGYLLDDVAEFRDAIVPAVPSVPAVPTADGALNDGIAYEDVDPADALIA